MKLICILSFESIFFDLLIIIKKFINSENKIPIPIKKIADFKFAIQIKVITIIIYKIEIFKLKNIKFLLCKITLSGKEIE